MKGFRKHRIRSLLALVSSVWTARFVRRGDLIVVDYMMCLPPDKICLPTFLLLELWCKAIGKVERYSHRGSRSLGCVSSVWTARLVSGGGLDGVGLYGTPSARCGVFRYLLGVGVGTGMGWF